MNHGDLLSAKAQSREVCGSPSSQSWLKRIDVGSMHMFLLVETRE